MMCTAVFRACFIVPMLSSIVEQSSGNVVHARGSFSNPESASSESEVEIIVNNDVTVESTTPSPILELMKQLPYSGNQQHQGRQIGHNLTSFWRHRDFRMVVGSNESRTELRQNQGFVEYPLSTTMPCLNHKQEHSWLIETENGQEVCLSFSEYSVTGVRSGDLHCGHSPSLEIYDGSSERYPNIASFCGDRHPSINGTFRSTKKQLFIVAKILCELTDGRYTQLHFKANFNAENIKSELNEESSPTDVQDDAAGCPCGQPTVESNIFDRIVGGTEAAAHSWPWQVSIRVWSPAIRSWFDYYEDKPDWMHICGGSLINSQWVVTAAHCIRYYNFLSPSRFRIVLGEHSLSDSESSERVVGVDRWIVHENYVSATTGNDIALIRLAENITFNDYIRPICLPEDLPSVDMFCVATGWGVTSDGYYKLMPDKLQQLRIPIEPIELCQPVLDKSDQGLSVDEVPGILCAGYPNVAKDTCQGDSGGPVACLSLHPHQSAADNTTSNFRWTLYGLTSAGIKCADFIEYPGALYTDVAYFKPWITQTISSFQRLQEVTQSEG